MLECAAQDTIEEHRAQSAAFEPGTAEGEKSGRGRTEGAETRVAGDVNQYVGTSPTSNATIAMST